jgi:tetratricopeptide (TPR) repeat protein
MKNLVLLGLAFITGVLIKAQTLEENIQAFKDSYAAEADGNFAMAIQRLEEIYRANSYELNLRLGWLNYLNQNYSKSSEYYQRSMKLLPYAFEPKLGFAAPEAAMGNWNNVLEVYEQILKADPQNTLVNYRMGAIYFERKDYQKAFQYLEKVVNLYPFDYDSAVLFAWTNYHLGRLRQAKVLFERTLMIRPDDTSSREGLNLIK